MKWSLEEDNICCKVCVDEYVINKRHMNVDFCLGLIMKNPRVCKAPGSIRMRIQNIKAILEEWEIPNTLYVSPLKNTAWQTRVALRGYLNEQGLFYDKI